MIGDTKESESCGAPGRGGGLNTREGAGREVEGAGGRGRRVSGELNGPDSGASKEREGATRESKQEKPALTGKEGGGAREGGREGGGRGRRWERGV